MAKRLMLVLVPLLIFRGAAVAHGADALQELRQKAEQGNAEAQYNLGIMYDNGEGVPENDIEAVKWYRKAAEQGYAKAQNNLGLMCTRGDGVPKNEAEAVKWYRMAAEQGNANAQVNLGVVYAKGEGVPENDIEAVKWYRKAAEQGYAEAQYNLGLMCAHGEGVPENDIEAVKWYRKAAEQGNAEAQVNLGRAYHLGEGVPENYIEAYKWFILSAAQGNKLAQDKKEIVARRMTPSMIAAAQERASNWHPQSGEPTVGQADGQPVSPGPTEATLSGSGFFINGRGDLITNYHIVNGCSTLRVWFGGKPQSASLLKSDERNDLALLRVKDFYDRWSNDACDRKRQSWRNGGGSGLSIEGAASR